MKKIFLIIALIFIAGIFALNEYLLYKQRPKDLAFVEESEKIEEREITMEDFPTRFVWNGKNSAPVLDTEIKQNYKTLITQAACLPPNFNGKYKIAQFGAGTMAHGFFIINLESGVVTEGFTFEVALDYSVDSELLIRNPKKAVLDCWKDEIAAGEKIPEWCITEYYRFENEELKMLGQLKSEAEK